MSILYTDVSCATKNLEAPTMGDRERENFSVTAMQICYVSVGVTIRYERH